MKCFSCKRPIRRGNEYLKRVEYRVSPDDGEIRIYGVDMADGPLSAAAGTLLGVAHSHCWWPVEKLRRRGGARTGGLIDTFAPDTADHGTRDDGDQGDPR